MTYTLKALHPEDPKRSKLDGAKITTNNPKEFLYISDYELIESDRKPGPKQRFEVVLPSLRVSKELSDRLPKEGLAGFRRKALEFYINNKEPQL